MISGKAQQCQHDQPGIDIRAPIGAVVYAAYEGDVYDVAYRGNYGNQIRIQHTIEGRSVKTVYAHLQRIDVKLGQSVKAGDVIGLADSTGNSSASHLHFGVKSEGVEPAGYQGYSNPASWLGLGA